MLNEPLAEKLGKVDDVVIVRLPMPSDIPSESALGRKRRPSAPCPRSRSRPSSLPKGLADSVCDRRSRFLIWPLSRPKRCKEVSINRAASMRYSCAMWKPDA